MRRWTLTKIMKATMPDSSGEMIQLDTIGRTPDQLTESTETPTAPKPITAPTIEWVVETGQPRMDAISNQEPAARREAIMPNTICSADIWVASRMPLRIVWVTEPPAR